MLSLFLLTLAVCVYIAARSLALFVGAQGQPAGVAQQVVAGAAFILALASAAAIVIDTTNVLDALSGFLGTTP